MNQERQIKRESLGYWQKLKLDEDLYIAIKANDKQKVIELLDEGAGENTRHFDATYIHHGYTMLMVATFNNNLEIMEILLKYGAKNIITDDNNSALKIAIRYNNMEAALLLLKYEDKVSEKYDDYGINHVVNKEVLLEAVKENYIEVVRYFLEKGADANSSCGHQYTLLMYAAMRGYIDMMKLLINYKAKLNCKTSNGMKVLHLAAKKGQLESVNFLLSHHIDDIDINDLNKFPYYETIGTPLMGAAVEGYDEIVKLLLEYNAEPNIQTTYGMTALMNAASHGKVSCVKLLLKFGAKIDLYDKYNRNALDLTYESLEYMERQNLQLIFGKRISYYKDICEVLLKYIKYNFLEIAIGLAPLNLPVLQVLLILSKLMDVSSIPERVQWKIAKLIKDKHTENMS